MTHRLLTLCAVAACGFFLHLADAQTGGPANRVGNLIHERADEYEAVPAPAKAIDGALADLMMKLSGVRLRSGTLDTEDLKKALQEGLRGLKPPGKLAVRSSAVCQVVDPQDLGGYWSGLGMQFVDGSADKYVWQTNLKLDEKKFALSRPPVAELSYHLVGGHFAEGESRPFRKTVHISTDYYVAVEVTVAFDPQAVAEGTAGKFSGAGSASPENHTMATALSLTDPVVGELSPAPTR